MSVALQAQRDSKVSADLESLSDRISLCSEMQKEASSDDEALLAVIGFLEACAPRVHALIQAGAEGILSEDTFMKCLEVNDKLLAILSDSDEEAPAPSPAPTTTDDLLLSVEDTKAPASHHPPSNSVMSMQEDLAKMAAAADPFAGSNSLLSPAPISEDSKVPSKMPPPLRAPSGGLASGKQPPLRAPSGQVQDSGDIFSTLPPPAPGPVKTADSDDLFDDLISDRKK
eukprot:CAMPEP_0182488260 /NCGR_PEP_ID=MMETSP1319-20130603/48318_1 /TAXON_ID=172717 /ORGANISM="Bolidomonas pacifica, Strain RCC208" /LENGTH=227 /DNA_ID=CAMNT_0024690387 /DNA_START=88 /DNA_END=771 /DNA_ORIENTATION=+